MKEFGLYMWNAPMNDFLLAVGLIVLVLLAVYEAVIEVRANRVMRITKRQR